MDEQTPMQRIRRALGDAIGLRDDVKLTDSQLAELVTRLCIQAQHHVPNLSVLARDL